MSWEKFVKVIGHTRTLRAEGHQAEALSELKAAWEEALAEGDQYSACGLAHDLGHTEVDAESQLRWHVEALRAADAVEDRERVRLFYPSLHLNLGLTYLRLGDNTKARHHLEAAEREAPVLPADD